MENFGKTLLVTNPTSQNGKSLEAAKHAQKTLTEWGVDLDVKFTEYAGHATEIAAQAAGYQTIIVLGGDGVVHETVGGLMKLPKCDRPTLGVIPMGSGNDFAKTLKMRTGVEHALEDLKTAHKTFIDVGCCNGEYFDETLSFGLDAAIALDTMERRKHTNKIEAALYFESGIDQLLHHLDIYHFEMELDGRNKLQGDVIMLAIQIGRTYGGGFIICPDAVIDDGIFDICYADGGIGVSRAIYIFGKAKNGKHEKYKEVHTTRASSIKLKFDRRPPCQMDGEPHIADSYDISILQQELPVLLND